MGTKPPNWQWCQNATQKERVDHFVDTHNSKNKRKNNHTVELIGFHDDLPEKTKDIAVCVIPANESALELLDITRNSIKSYAKKCGADYIELAGDQHPDWPISNKFRLYTVTTTYKKTLYLDCDIVVKEDSPNIFELTPNDKISAYDEIHIWESDEKGTEWIRKEQELIRSTLNEKEIKENTSNAKLRMINSGVLVIPQALADYYKQPSEEYPRNWCFDQNYLTLRLPDCKLFNLPIEFNTCFTLKDKFFETAKSSHFIHINNMTNDLAHRKRIISSFLPRDTRLKFNTHLFEGFNSHRSGWSYAISKMQNKHHSDSGIVIDDFFERSHSWKYNQNFEKGIIPYRQDWIGFVHNPSNIPSWFHGEHSPTSILERQATQESLKRCKAIFTFSEHNASVLKSLMGHLYDFPVLSLKAALDDQSGVKWSPQLFKKSEKRLILIGYWLRKITYFALLKTSYKKIWLRGQNWTADKCWSREKLHIKQNASRDFDFAAKEFLEMFGHGNGVNNTVPNMEIPDRLENDQYDEMLSSGIVFLNFYDTVANNAVVECIARNTPLVVCKHPSVIEYLGKDYPCYFTNKEEAEKIIHDDKLILEAHEFLKTIDKSWLSSDYFAQDFITKLKSSKVI